MIDIEISRSVFNAVYLPYLDDNHRFLVFYGGAGSGKSFFIAQRYVYKMLTAARCNVLVVRQVGRTNRDSTFALMRQVIGQWGLERLFCIRSGDLRITCKENGNEMIFNGLDDSEKLKSITFANGELTDVWIEEASETLEKDFKQINIRLRGGHTKKQIVISFNPIDVNHWLKHKFFDDKSANTEILHTTYRDNRFLDSEYREELESYKITDPYYYAVYCLGQWGVYGKSVFSAQKIQERLDSIVPPMRIGNFLYDYDGLAITNIRFCDDIDGYVSIYRDKTAFGQYAIGGDTSGDGSDWFVGQVFDADGTQCAALRHGFDEDLYARQMYCMGMYYNKALIGVEINYSTHPVRELERLGYPNQYVRVVMDTFTHKPTNSFGFRTDRQTRPVIIAELVEFIRDHIEKINDKTTLFEMLTFVRSTKGRPEAQNGAHDDCIMSAAIGIHLLSAISTYSHNSAVDMDSWTDDMREDWENADDEGRRYLESKWHGYSAR